MTLFPVLRAGVGGLETSFSIFTTYFSETNVFRQPLTSGSRRHPKLNSHFNVISSEDKSEINTCDELINLQSVITQRCGDKHSTSSTLLGIISQENVSIKMDQSRQVLSSREPPKAPQPLANGYYKPPGYCSMARSVRISRRLWRLRCHLSR